jgi:hypothetical protein
MGNKRKCNYCDNLAVAYQMEADGGTIPICAYHIPLREDQRLPERQESSLPTKAKDHTGIGRANGQPTER